MMKNNQLSMLDMVCENNENGVREKKEVKCKQGLKSVYSKHKTLKDKEYPIDIRYGEKDWDMVAAIREPLANMLDTKAEYSYKWVDGFCYIEDMGAGLPLSAFILGASSKSNDQTSIGQFGEGLKLTFITALRNDRIVDISTVGYGATIERFYSEVEETTLMRVKYNDNSRELGTCIKIECSKEEWECALGLFLQFKEGYQKVDNNLFLPSGYVCILGLTTEERPNMVFSYDLNDKSVTNRDRNVIKSKGLKTNMIKILNGLKTQRAVKLYFEALAENYEAEEFKLALEPRDKNLWLNTVKRLYGDKVCYSTTVQNDLKAQTKGYYVLRNVTNPVVKTLKYLGIDSSKAVTADIKGDVGFVEKKEQKIRFTISEDYCSDWTFIDAGREFLANALDASGDKVKRYFKDGYYHIEDSGDGMLKEHFVIGNSQKSDTEIGKFGEGLKIAALVMTRQGRDVSIETVGTTYLPVIEHNDEFSINLFAINYKKNRKKKGTVIKFKATEDEVNEVEGLFLAFKSNYSMIEGDNVDVIVEDKGFIYVNGLQAANVGTLFSYNVRDKGLVNTRDRNSVNEEKLSSYLVQFLNDTQDRKVIEKLLSSWRCDNNKYEYKLILNPNNLGVFREVAEELFADSCIASYDMIANATVVTAGHELLTEIPPYIRDILMQCGVKSAEDVAVNYKNGISVENRLVTIISPDYASHWNSSYALRELISNAIDSTGGKENSVVVECNNGTGVIEDLGKGIKKENLIFGNTDKREDSSKIGYFGEGLKMALLVLARENKNVIVETVGYTITPKIELDKTFGVNLLVIYFEENSREVGTKITFKSNKKEIEESRKMFLVFNDSYKQVEEDMYTPGGTIFLNGVAMEGVQDAKFSYNIIARDVKSILDRDRQMLDYDTKMRCIGNILAAVKNEEVISEFIKRASTYTAEQNFAPHISLYGRQKITWRKVAEEIYPKSCLPSMNHEVNLVAKDSGFKILDTVDYNLRKLLEKMNFQTADTAVTLRGDYDTARRVIEPENLDSKEKQKWDTVMDAIYKEYGDEYKDKVLICEEFTNPDEGVTLGLYSKTHDRCYILRELLTRDFYSVGRVMGIVAHEICHRESGEYDRTRGFENALTNKIGELLAKLYN